MVSEAEVKHASHLNLWTHLLRTRQSAIWTLPAVKKGCRGNCFRSRRIHCRCLFLSRQTSLTLTLSSMQITGQASRTANAFGRIKYLGVGRLLGSPTLPHTCLEDVAPDDR